MALLLTDRRLVRTLSGSLVFAVASLLVTARVLTPASRGFGTHEQLGLPRCLISRALGRERCPSCGLTTALSLAMRFELHRAEQASPLVLPTLLGLSIALVAAGFSTLSGSCRPWASAIPLLGAVLLVLAVRWVSVLGVGAGGPLSRREGRGSVVGIEDGG